jgi:hypothetical protein
VYWQRFRENFYNKIYYDIRTVCIFGAGMKKILFRFCIALAILLPKYFYAQDARPAHVSDIAQQEYNFFDGQVGYDDPFFSDWLDEDSDDNLNDSERRKGSFGKTTCNITSFIVRNFSNNYLRRNAVVEFPGHTRIAHYLFTRSFRI